MPSHPNLSAVVACQWFDTLHRGNPGRRLHCVVLHHYSPHVLLPPGTFSRFQRCSGTCEALRIGSLNALGNGTWLQSCHQPATRIWEVHCKCTLVSQKSSQETKRSERGQTQRNSPNTCPEGTVKVFLRCFTRPSPDCGAAMSHGDSVPGDKRTHRTACVPASTERGCGST